MVVVVVKRAVRGKGGEREIANEGRTETAYPTEHRSHLPYPEVPPASSREVMRAATSSK